MSCSVYTAGYDMRTLVLAMATELAENIRSTQCGSFVLRLAGTVPPCNKHAPKNTKVMMSCKTTLAHATVTCHCYMMNILEMQAPVNLLVSPFQPMQVQQFPITSSRLVPEIIAPLTVVLETFFSLILSLSSATRTYVFKSQLECSSPTGLRIGVHVRGRLGQPGRLDGGHLLHLVPAAVALLHLPEQEPLRPRARQHRRCVDAQPRRPPWRHTVMQSGPSLFSTGSPAALNQAR